jgi:formate hydrogenlyase subunit 4
METARAVLNLSITLAAAPFLFSVINRTKALFSGRVGQPWLQPYFDLWKLLHKGAVYSRTTTWVFRAGPVVNLAAVLTALALLPFGAGPALVAFPGDLLLFVYLLGVGRFFLVLAALDTGSAFEGMGASREVLFSALAEPALLLGLVAVAREMPEVSLSLSDLHAGMTPAVWGRAGLTLALVAIAFGVILLAENGRIPVDDQTTHLELTMIHEVMVLDHSGPDFACILYAQALKFWTFAVLLVGVALPLRSGVPVLDTLLALSAVVVLAALVGVVESSMARLRMTRVAQLLVAATALAAVAFVLER